MRAGNVRARLLAALIASAVWIPQAPAAPPAAPSPISWTSERVDAPRTFSFQSNANRTLALDSAGEPHVVYGGDRLYHARHDAGGWHVEIVDSSAGVGETASIAVDRNDVVHVVYRDGVNSRLLHATNATGAWVVDVVSATGFYSGGIGGAVVALDGAGKAHVVYFADVARELRYATNKSGAWADVRIDAEGFWCDLALDAAGAAHVAYSTGVPSVSLRYATNAGGRWRTETADVDPSGARQYGQGASIALDSAGVAHVAYQDYVAATGATRIRYATNAGGRWSAQVVAGSDGAGSDNSIAVDGTGKVHLVSSRSSSLVYATDASGAFATEGVEASDGQTSIAVRGGVVHVVHHDGEVVRHVVGASHAWTGETVDESTIAAYGVRMKLDKNGAAHVLEGVHSGHSELHYLTNAGGAWTTTVVDASTNGLGFDFALDGAGHVLVAYYGAPSGSSSEVRFATNASGAFVSEVLGTTGQYSTSLALALDSAGVPHVAYDRASDLSIQYATRAAGGAWTSDTVQSATYFASFSLAIDASDHPHVVYHRVTDQTIVHATNASGSWVRAVAASSVAPDPSVYLAGTGSPQCAVDSLGHVHVVFAASPPFLTVRHATDASGTWTTEDVAPGLEPSIAIDAADRPHAAFSAGIGYGGHLGYAVRDAGGWTSSIVDVGSGGARQFTAAAYAVREDAGKATISVSPSGGGAVAGSNSIDVAADGTPRFAYSDDTLGDLKFARPDDGSTPPTKSVDYAASAGTAEAPTDFTPTTGTLGWTAEDTATKSFTVDVHHDPAVTGNQTVNLELKNPTNGLVLVDPATAVLVIEDVDLPVGTIQSFFLPRSVKLSINAKTKSKSRLVASGYFDTGLGPVDLTLPATLTVGGLTFAIPRLAKQTSGAFHFRVPGVDFTITPPKFGSSRAKFRLSVVGDFTGAVDPDGPLTLRFADGLVDGSGTVALSKGVYAIGRRRGSLTAPSIYFLASRTALVGGGKDSLFLRCGLGSVGATPATAPDVTVAFGPKFKTTILGPRFAPKSGDRFVFADKKGGVTSMILDYKAETLTLDAKNVDLGTFGAGPQPVLVTVGAGGTHAALVRMVHQGKGLRY